MSEVRYFPKKFWCFLKRCWAYKEWLWVDRDWDYEFLLMLLSIKLDRMEAFFRSDKPNLERTPITARQVGRAAKLAHRLLEDNYIYRDSEAAEEADLMQLCDLLKNMRSWWD